MVSRDRAANTCNRQDHVVRTRNGSTMRNSATMRLLLPEPVRPTMPIFWPASTRKVTPRSTASSSGRYRTHTSLNVMAPSVGHPSTGLSHVHLLCECQASRAAMGVTRCHSQRCKTHCRRRRVLLGACCAIGGDAMQIQSARQRTWWPRSAAAPPGAARSMPSGAPRS